MFRKARTLLNKFKFFFGRTPKIDNSSDYRKFIPEPYSSVLLMSADFELAWAPRYDKNEKDPLKFAIQKAQQERENFPKILELCEQSNIPITWATVGHLFLEECSREGNCIHSEIPAIPKYKGPFWNFAGGDWFEYDPGTNLNLDNNWYAPDLIKKILESKIPHEIGCHTFSHIDCREEACSPELMRAELKTCKKLAEGLNLKLESFVHPGHTIGNLDVLVDEGFTNFRTDYRNVLSYPKKLNNGLWEFEQTAELAFRSDWSIAYHKYRYKRIIERAINYHTLCVLWFHPSFDSLIIKEILPDVFEFINRNKNNIWVTTHKKYCDWLNNNS